MAARNSMLLGTRKGLVVYTKNGQGKWAYNSGENQECINSNLPMVHSVEFV
ncbi:MAG: hypothetical protein O2887_13685 [Bacteroidetes bacterium]|nr:hypothetical protein [Bacteroidota bacterium]MDA1121522.1 hypothetical protein [Bacteroidota bacterium]